MRVALPSAGVLDMLRYHRLSPDNGWAYDYGTVDESKDMFDYLLSYSPLHNVAPANYPATLLTTMANDTQVPPAHSYKFTAELQNKQTSLEPILIQIDTSSNHAHSNNTDDDIQRNADILSFTLFNMGYQKLPHTPSDIED